MSYEDIQLFIPLIKDYWTRKLIACQYATGCRIGELVIYKHKNGIETHGLRYERISEHPEYWKLTFPVFKVRQILNEPRYISKHEQWLMNELEPLFKQNTQGPVFPFRFSKARQLVKQELRQLGFDEESNLINKTFSSHNLRATRITHLINPPLNFNLIEAQEFVCLKRADTIKHYYKSDPLQRLNKFKTA
jgi:integrase